MSWVRIDDKAWSHPKLANLSGNAVKLWLFGLCWCNQHETDGKIPYSALKLIGGKERVVQELVEASLWRLTALVDGYEVHDYLEYQPSREQRAQQREASKTRVAKHRQAPRVTTLQDHIVTALHERTPDECNAPPDPVPIPTRPNPTGEQSTRARDGAGHDPDAETTCPLDLVAKARNAGVFSHMVAKMPGVDVAQLEAKAQEFVGYWTIGAGMGSKRRHWLKKLREDLRRAHLERRLKAIGELEHEAQTGGTGLGDRLMAKAMREATSR